MLWWWRLRAWVLVRWTLLLAACGHRESREIVRLFREIRQMLLDAGHTDVEMRVAYESIRKGSET